MLARAWPTPVDTEFPPSGDGGDTLFFEISRMSTFGSVIAAIPCVISVLTDSDSMKTSDLFVKCLENEGIEYIFGVPGEENADFVMSLADSKSLRFVLTRHEQGASFMAEVYGRLTGNPACCLGTL